MVSKREKHQVERRLDNLDVLASDQEYEKIICRKGKIKSTPLGQSRVRCGE